LYSVRVMNLSRVEASDLQLLHAMLLDVRQNPRFCRQGSEWGANVMCDQ
jgi:hypothetical protein